MDYWGLYIILQIFAEFSLKPVYPNTTGEIVQIHVVKITEKCICESKNWIFLFLFMPPSKTLSQVLNILATDRWKLLISPRQNFLKIEPFCFKEGVGGRRNFERAEKVTKLVKVLVTSFEKSHHLCTLHFCGYCFALP